MNALASLANYGIPKSRLSWYVVENAHWGVRMGSDKPADQNVTIWKGKKPTEEELKQILADHKNWLNGELVDPPPHDLSGADLSKVDLSGAKLIGAKLSGADLSKAVLSEADLRVADLSKANLSEATLRQAVLNKADLSKAKLIGANLGTVNLKEAVLRGADLSGAMLIFASLNLADLSEAVLNKADVRMAHLSKANLSETKMTDINLADTVLEGADLQDAIMERANFFNCSLQEADLRRANLKDAKNLLVSQLAGSYLTGAILPEGAAKFERVDAAVRSASHARKMFTPFILACLIVLLVAFQAKLGEGIEVNYAGVKISISAMWFALGMPTGLLALFSYFLYYMGQLWENLAALPARLPDGAPIYRYPDPWFLINFTRKHLRLLGESWGTHRATTAMFFIWWVGPLTLAAATIGFFYKLKDSEVLCGNFIVFLMSCGIAYLNHFEARQTLQTLGRGTVSLEGKSLLWTAFSLSAGAVVWAVAKFLVL